MTKKWHFGEREEGVFKYALLPLAGLLPDNPYKTLNV